MLTRHGQIGIVHELRDGRALLAQRLRGRVEGGADGVVSKCAQSLLCARASPHQSIVNLQMRLWPAAIEATKPTCAGQEGSRGVCAFPAKVDLKPQTAERPINDLIRSGNGKWPEFDLEIAVDVARDRLEEHGCGL